MQIYYNVLFDLGAPAADGDLLLRKYLTSVQYFIINLTRFIYKSLAQLAAPRQDVSARRNMELTQARNKLRRLAAHYDAAAAKMLPYARERG